MPRVTGSEVARALERAEWERVRQEGSHVRLRHPTRPGRETVPVHRGTILPLATLANILRRAEMTVADLKELL